MFLRNNQGFTFVELLIGVSVTAILGVLILASFVQSRNVRDLVSTGQNALSVLRLAQAKTLAGEGNASWGVHFEAGRFVLFQGASYAGATFTEQYLIPSSLEIADISLAGGGSDVIFSRLAGTTDQPGTLSVRIISSGGNIFSITIEGSGKIFQTGASPAPAGTRIIDARHRNFNLAGTIQNAVTMQLTFSDPPNADIPVPITMIPPPPRGAFDWTGAVVIGGRNQTLRIHALSITAGATELSVDRDCRKNDKKVKISFDGNDVATYEADCRTITVSAFGGTMVEP